MLVESLSTSPLPPYIIVNQSQIIIFVDLEIKEFLGWEPDELLGKKIEEVVPDYESQFIKNFFEIRITTQYEALLKRKNGTVFSILCIISPVRPEGHLITFLQRRECMDTEPKTFGFKYFFESNFLGIIVADIHNQIMDANDAFLDMVGYTREDFQSGLFGWWALVPENTMLR